MKTMKQLTIWICACTIACLAMADEIIRVGNGGGNPDFVEGTWPAGSIVVVTGPVTVGNGTSLTIAAGTVVKLEDGASLYVQGGGTLEVNGTATAPVKFTASYTYRTIGEDAVTGTWEGVSVAGTANFHHAELLYGGTDTQGLLTVCSGGVVHMDRSLLAHSTGIGIWNNGELWMTNSAIYDTEIAAVYLDEPGVKGASHAQFTHCVIDCCELGVYQGGGDGVFYNCDISDYRTYGATYLDGMVTFERCNFYSQRGIMVSASPLEANRKLEVAPCFIDPENYDFRLAKYSGLIDAGDAVAGATVDAFENGRTNAPHVTPTGTADSLGIYPDIGLHEWQPTYTEADVDIFVWDIQMEPAEAKTGDALTVTWTLVNAGSDAFSGTWRDALSLVPTYGAAVSLGEIEHTGTIGGGEEMLCSATVVVPPVADRIWEVKVVANADGGVLEKLDAVEPNENLSGKTLTTKADVWDVASSLAVEIPADEALVYAVTGVGTDEQALKVSGVGVNWTATGAYHGIPTEAYSWENIRGEDGAIWLWMPKSASATEAYLVLKNTGNENANLLLQGMGAGMQIFGTDRQEITLSTNTSITVDGIGLATGVAGVLQREGTNERYEAVLGGVGPVRRHAIFDLHEAMAGTYRFGISDGLTTAWMEGTISVSVPETGAVLRTVTMMPVQFHAGVTYEGIVIYANEGDADMWLPEFVVSAGDEGGTVLSLSPDGPFVSSTLLLRGFSPTEPECVLKAGERGQLSFFFQAMQGVNVRVTTRDERSAIAYQNMQTAQDDAKRQSYEQAERAFALKNENIPIGNPEMMSGRIEGYLLMTGTETPVAGKKLVIRGTRGQSTTAGVMRWEKFGTAITGPDGSFVFEGLPVGSTFLFNSDEVGLESADEVCFEDMSNPILSGCIVHVEELYYCLSGQVTGEGMPLAGVTVQLKSASRWDKTETDAAGRWSFPNLREGEYEVQALAHQGFAKSPTTEVELLSDTEVALEMPHGGIVHATAKMALTEAPIAGIWVVAYDMEHGLMPDRAMSDEDGHLEFKGLPAGTYLFDSEDVKWRLATSNAPVVVASGSEQTVELEFEEDCFFAAWPYFGAYPLRVEIDYLDETRIPSDVEKWEWDFNGDGVVDGTNRNARYTYETNGVYDIELKATLSDGTTNVYRLNNGVEVIEPVAPVMRDNVIILGPTNTDYEYVSLVAGASNQELLVRQLLDNPSQPIALGTVFIIDNEINQGPPLVKVVSSSRSEDIWQLETVEVTDVKDVFSSFQLVPTGDILSPDGEEPGLQHRASSRAGDGIEVNVWKSKDKNATIDVSFDTSEGTFHPMLFYSEVKQGIHFELMWKRSFIFGLHIQVHTNATGTAHKEIGLGSKDVSWPIADCSVVGVWFTASIENKLDVDLTWNVGTEVDSYPELRWEPRVRVWRDPGYGEYIDGGWHVSGPDAPKLGFRDGKNKWELSGGVTGSTKIRTEAKLAFQAKAIAGKINLLDIMNGKAWFEAVAKINANIDTMNFDFEWGTDYGAELNFLSFEGTILDSIFGVKWTAWKCPLIGDKPFEWPKLSWPFGSAEGAFGWPKPLIPDLNINLGSLFGWVPKFSWPGFPPDFSGWEPPSFPKFNWPSGTWPLTFPSFDFSAIEDWSDWEFNLDLAGLKFPNLDFSMGLSLPQIFANMANLKLNFTRLGINFHFPELEGFDFEAPVICLPQFSLPFKPALRRIVLPNLKASLPSWTGLGNEWLNLPMELYLDWGDGDEPYTLDLSGKTTVFDIRFELNRLLQHEYPGPGIYQGEVGIRLRYINAANKHLKFTAVILNQDFDGDGMPNMWEALYHAVAEEGKPGLNPLDPSDADQDFDDDGLTNLQEFLAGTHPLEADIDGDKMPDGFEVMYMVPPKGKNYKGLNPWKADADDDADHDDMTNGEEYKYEGGDGDYGLPSPLDSYTSTNPMDPDTDGGGMEDGEEYKSKGTNEEKNPFDPQDDAGKCRCCEELKWDDEREKYNCERIEECHDEEKPEPNPQCASWVPNGEDERGCPKWKLVAKDNCPPDDDPPDDPYEVCKDIETSLCKYCAVCKDGIVQWALSHITFSIKVACDTNHPTALGGVIASLSGVGGGGSGGIGGTGGAYGSSGGGMSTCGKDPRKDKKKKGKGTTPNSDSSHAAARSAIYLPMGDYVDESMDLTVWTGGTDGGVERYLENNEWSFREAASMLALAPGEGTEGTVAAGAGTLGVEWNGSGAPGAAAGLTNEATGVSLKSVPTGLWGVWEGTTQALIRVEYGLVGNHGTVTTNYGELVQAWRRAVEGGNDSAAAALESVATGGVVRVTSAEDAEGRRTSYEWNGSGLMTVAHFADGTQESYEYGSGNLMSGKTKRDGEHVGLTHDNFGYLTGLNNTKYEYTYDSGTKTYYAAIRYPDGRVGERWFDDTGAIIRHSMNGAVVYDEAAVKADALLTTKPAWPKETLNDAALPVTVEYRSGATEAFTWDGPGYQRSGVMEATGEELAWTYDGMGREMSSIRAGLAADVDRDAAGYVTRARLVSASGTETAEWDWDAAGNASEGRMGAWTRTNTYDLAGRVMSATTADGGTWAFTRDAEGRATAWTQPDGASGAKAYDGRGRLTWRRSPSGVETWWHHATNGLLTGWSNSLGRRVSYQYDKGERVAKATDEDGDVRTYEYDSAGNWRGLAPELRTFVNDGEGGLSLSVTNGGRVTTARRLWGTWFLRDVQANDQTWRLERNDEGQVTALVRAPMAGAPTTNSWAYDAAGRMTGWTDATGVSWSRGYDAAGFIAWETNGAGAGRSWTHDGTGRLTAVSDGAGRTSTFVYDPATGRTTTDLSDGSRLVSQSDAWGREIARTDAAGTLVATERRFDGAMLRRTWTAAGAELADLEATWSWDGDGQLLAQGMTGGPSTRFERTGSNRCERTVTSFGAFEAGAAVERDANGRVIAVTGADGERAECVWGDDGEVSGWMLPEGSVWFARDLTERTRTTLLPSGHLVTERTDLAGLVTNVSLSDADGMEAWSLALVRDAAGRIVSQGASTLAWDGAGRLVSVDGTSYARDAAGNRSGSGWTTEGMDRLAAWPGGTYGYDTNGAVVTRTCGAEELSFVRDLAGRVSEVRDATDGLVARFIYDADGRRLGKETADGAQKWYLWNGGRLAAELSGTGVVERVFGYWSEASRTPDWVRANGVLLVVLKDGFGVPTALVSALNGAVTEVNTGTTFGEGWACPMAPVWADGLLADAETGLMGGPDGRLYDPTTGRWLSPTPGTLEAGLNRYAREPAAVGTVREFPGLSMPGVDPEYDVLYAFARRCGADAETAATLARAELLLSLEARSDAAARSWVRQRDAATADAALRLVGEVPAGQFLCTRKGIESFLKSRRDVLEVTTELDAYGKLRSSMDLEEAFRLELAWSAGAEDRVSMGAWRGTWGWAGLHPEGCPATERWKALLLGAAHGERLSEENLEYLGEAKLFALSDWERSATPLDEEKAREKVDEALTELRRVLKSWANDECE